MKQASWRHHFGIYIFLHWDLCAHQSFLGPLKPDSNLKLQFSKLYAHPLNYLYSKWNLSNFLFKIIRKKTHTTLFVNWWYLFEIATIKWNHAHFLLLCGKICHSDFQLFAIFQLDSRSFGITNLNWTDFVCNCSKWKLLLHTPIFKTISFICQTTSIWIFYWNFVRWIVGCWNTHIHTLTYKTSLFLRIHMW